MSFGSSENVFEDSTNSEVIIFGDFNTNVRNKTGKNMVKDLNNLCPMLNFKQFIDELTRIVGTRGESIFDLLLVSHPGKDTQHGIIKVGSRDHLMTFCTRKIKIPELGGKKYKIQSLKKYSVEKLKGLAQAKIIKKSGILFRVLNMTTI